MDEKVPIYVLVFFFSLNRFKLDVWQKQVFAGGNITLLRCVEAKICQKSLIKSFKTYLLIQLRRMYVGLVHID